MNGNGGRVSVDEDWTRRQVLKGTGVTALALGPGAALAQAVAGGAANATTAATAPTGGQGERIFRIEQSEMNPDGARAVSAVTVNGGLPGPELRFHEGDIFRVLVDNRLAGAATTVHWHGLLLPSAMDGVPGITQQPIPPGEYFLYEFPLRQSGTYWYHSHYELQEQRGLAGALIIEAKSEDIAYDRDYVLFLSDWLHADPAQIIPNLRRAGGGMKMGATDGGMKDMEMGTNAAPDLSDVTYDAFLLNGLGAKDPWVGTARAGERVRFRLINGGASTLFRFGIDGHRLTVTHADGQPVEPVEVDFLLIGMGECYDVLVRVGQSGSYTIRAEAQDGSGQAIGILRTTDAAAKAVVSKPRWEGRQLDYGQLRARAPMPVPPPTRTYTLPLGGRMSDYVWMIGGQLWPDAEPLIVVPGEQALVELPNQTRMWHPMHLHGHFFRLLVEGVDPQYAPLKHTANVAPGQTLRFQFLADNPGRWFFHCHNSYHLLAGMAREWIYKAPA